MYIETSYLFLSYQSSSVFTSFSVGVFLFGNACAYPGGHALVLVFGFAWGCCVDCALLH